MSIYEGVEDESNWFEKSDVDIMVVHYDRLVDPWSKFYRYRRFKGLLDAIPSSFTVVPGTPD